MHHILLKPYFIKKVELYMKGQTDLKITTSLNSQCKPDQEKPYHNTQFQRHHAVYNQHNAEQTESIDGDRSIVGDPRTNSCIYSYLIVDKGVKTLYVD